MKLVIDYFICYGYDEEVKFFIQYLCLMLCSIVWQMIIVWMLILLDGVVVIIIDGWGNVLYVLMLDNLYKEIIICVSGIVDIVDEGEEMCDEEVELLLLLVFLCCMLLICVDMVICEFVQCFYCFDVVEESLN